MMRSAGSGTRRSARVRCAVYTRKSSEEGLDQEFNSLQAQREACEAFISSQRHEGWVCLPACYDDGGFSGATMDRPALQRLLTDITARRVDIVVVYKIDQRLAITDFPSLFDTGQRIPQCQEPLAAKRRGVQSLIRRDGNLAVIDCGWRLAAQRNPVIADDVDAHGWVLLVAPGGGRR
jgi:hypothetical protein